MKTLRTLFGIVMLSIGLASCVTAPANGAQIWPYSGLHLSGYGLTPGATVSIRMLNKQTNTWETVATALTSTTETNVNGDKLYFWHTAPDLVIANLPRFQCYVSAQCRINQGSASVQMKATENGFDLVTFEADGTACIFRELEEGKGGHAAGYECRSEESPVLTFRWVT